MASITTRGNTKVQTGHCGCESPACPDCGGLECLCRPRFFAGQLLTDEDLRRLDYYITAKNKLHNRYLVGWGVACGLEVVCSPCDGEVTVRPGYALSPCGEDIVVCNAAAVDICSLIQQCRKQTPRNCQQPQLSNANDPCNSATEKWILSIHYDETTSRGVVPLKNTGGAACCSKCACGGSSSCGCKCHTPSRSSGCGCNGSGKTTGSNGSTYSNGSCGCSTKTAQASPQCEPTVVCEGYRFTVCKIVSDPPASRGQIIERFLCCYNELKALVSTPPKDPALLQAWCCTIRDNLVDYLADNPGYNCSILDRLAVLCNSGNQATIVADVVFGLTQFLRDCFCALFLPPCPCPVEDSSVPLATITVSKKGGCRVVSICNIDARKFLVTFPNLGYWLSEIPLGRNLRKALSKFCCTPLVRRETGGVSTGTTGLATGAATTGTPNETTDFAELAALAFARRGSPADMQTLAMATLGLRNPSGAPFLTDFELEHPLETLLLNQFGVPAADDILAGVQQTTSTGGAAPPAGVAAPGGTQPDLAKEVEELRARLSQVQSQLDTLAGKIDKEG